MLGYTNMALNLQTAGIEGVKKIVFSQSSDNGLLLDTGGSVFLGFSIHACVDPKSFWTQYFVNHLGNFIKFAILMHLRTSMNWSDFEIKGQRHDQIIYDQKSEAYTSAAPHWVLSSFNPFFLFLPDF